jgi:hypothetical protein
MRAFCSEFKKGGLVSSWAANIECRNLVNLVIFQIRLLALGQAYKSPSFRNKPDQVIPGFSALRSLSARSTLEMGPEADRMHECDRKNDSRITNVAAA